VSGWPSTEVDDPAQNDVHDNSDVELNILFGWMEVDLEHTADDVAQ
jgi:hypothetical protein